MYGYSYMILQSGYNKLAPPAISLFSCTSLATAISLPQTILDEPGDQVVS